MNTPLRDDLKHLRIRTTRKYPRLDDKEIDEILNLVASKMPEKKELAAKYPSGFDKGFNQAIEDVKSILKGEESQ